MKKMLFIAIFVSVLLVDSSFVYGTTGNSVLMSKSFLERGGSELLTSSDSTLSDVELLPFNIHDKDELAPAIKNGYLYYVEREGKRQEYSIYRIPLDSINLISENDFGEQSSNNKIKEKIDMPENVYLNYSVDGRMLLLNTVDKYNVSKDLFIGLATEERKDLVPFPYNGKRYSIGRATLSPDGEILVFSSDMTGSLGGIDLWMSIWENGSWSVPQNLGKEINTIDDEAMPNFLENNKLCFASSGHEGFGGYDLFYSELKNHVFSAPVNMGAIVNTASDEIGICYSVSTNLYYFASNKMGNYDIYAVSPYNELPKVMAEDVIARNYSEILQADTDSSFYSNELSEDDSLLSEQEFFQLKMNDIEKTGEMSSSYFYAIQVMALRASTYSKERVLKMFGMENQYYIVREEGWTKFRIGEFSSYRKAKKIAKELGIKKFYIVRMNSSQIEEYL